MFYRRKIILSLLQLFEGQIDKISLQKLLFLFTQRQVKPDYDFIPYKFGCYSYSAVADLGAMVRRGMVDETPVHYISKEKTDYLKLLKEDDRNLLAGIKAQFGGMTAGELMKYTYLKFPYWAINSIKAKEILSEAQFEKVKLSHPGNDKTVLFTIGYEGLSLEDYLNQLVKNDIKVLVDVRNNPLSMKFGFSKSSLSRYCESLGIRYVHFPEVGIQSEQRRELNTQSDYDQLFAVYRQNNLTETSGTQLRILNLLRESKRIALTCFEANSCQCHRKHLAEAIENLPDFEYEVNHL
ncbi:MAG: DUF488 domain-containing protein [Bacteroidetes bacterium]|nr:DUF488 domain-containing protein [Bacteroidota bacterium]MCA0447145.1 DUF488 domain-containing protein [Bacteroidota bacterium]